MKATSIIGIGAIGFAILAILAIVLAGGWMEDDLAERSNNRLTETGLDWASVEMDGRDAVLSGTAPDAKTAEKAIQIVSDIWGVRVVSDETAKP